MWRKWLTYAAVVVTRIVSRVAHRMELAKDHVAIKVTGGCGHRTHAEMIAARSYCPDCRRRYVNWAIGAGLEIDSLSGSWARRGQDGRSEWVDLSNWSARSEWD